MDNYAQVRYSAIGLSDAYPDRNGMNEKRYIETHFLWILPDVPLSSERRIMGLSSAASYGCSTVDRSDHPGSKPFPRLAHQGRRTVVPVGLLAVSAILLAAVLVANLQSEKIALALLVSLICAMLIFALLLADTIRTLRRSECEARNAFAESEQDFRHMAENIQEIFWMMDPRTKNATFVNPAYETITGRSCQSLVEDPSSYEKAIHPDDLSRILQKLDEAAQSGHFEQQFRIVRPGGEVRWVWAHGFPRQDLNGNLIQIGGTALDITAQKQAEEQVVANLTKANSAWAEAEALRKATLALTEDLHMDAVLDALLCSLAELVPYACARVLVPEGGPHWLTLGEKSLLDPAKKHPRVPLTFDASESPFFQRLVSERRRLLIADTNNEGGWESFAGHKEFRSWLGVPLVASEEFLGFLSAGHLEPNQFTEDHLRRAALLAIPAAVAIQNARLYATAEMYGSELEKRLADLESVERALDRSEEGRIASEEKFQKIFHASPIALSITTLEEGRFLEVNAAFEAQYGYSRLELLGHTVQELRIWEDAGDRKLLLSQLQRGGPIRNLIARLRTKSGEIKLTTYAADRIQFDGKACILAVSELMPLDDGRQVH